MPWSVTRETMLHGFSFQLWMRLSGALQKKKNSELSYREIIKNSSNDETIAAKQVTWGSQPVRRKCWAEPVCSGRRERSPLRLPLVGLLGRVGSPFTQECGLEYTCSFPGPWGLQGE